MFSTKSILNALVLFVLITAFTRTENTHFQEKPIQSNGIFVYELSQPRYCNASVIRVNGIIDTASGDTTFLNFVEERVHAESDPICENDTSFSRILVYQDFENVEQLYYDTSLRIKIPQLSTDNTNFNFSKTLCNDTNQYLIQDPLQVLNGCYGLGPFMVIPSLTDQSCDTVWFFGYDREKGIFKPNQFHDDCFELSLDVSSMFQSPCEIIYRATLSITQNCISEDTLLCNVMNNSQTDDYKRSPGYWEFSFNINNFYAKTSLPKIQISSKEQFENVESFIDLNGNQKDLITIKPKVGNCFSWVTPPSCFLYNSDQYPENVKLVVQGIGSFLSLPNGKDYYVEGGDTIFDGLGYSLYDSILLPVDEYAWPIIYVISDFCRDYYLDTAYILVVENDIPCDSCSDTVTNKQPSGFGSLYQVLGCANYYDTIWFDPVLYGDTLDIDYDVWEIDRRMVINPNSTNSVVNLILRGSEKINIRSRVEFHNVNIFHETQGVEIRLNPYGSRVTLRNSSISY